MNAGTFKTVDIVSLGCSKNLIDSERLMAQLKANNIRVTHDAEKPKGEVVVINTCGFIGDAKEESIETILQFAKLKKKGRIKKLYVMGCLSERYREDLTESIPEVDKFYGKFDWNGIVTELGATYRRDLMSERSVTTPGHYAYLKISEGCNRMCSYCAIPLITGRHTSRPMEEILGEVEKLAKDGVKEIQVIAQDLSSYGTDLYKENKLAELVDKMAQVEGIEWIRLHYAYPAGFPKDLLPVMAKHKNICKYLDLAFQHISDNMLKKMRRKITKEQMVELLKEIREQVPGIHIRTTFIAGHPGETEADFEELKEFIREVKFERLGVFPYSHEEDTYSYKNYEDDVPDDVKQKRADEIMEIQSEISQEINNEKIGKKMRVIIDREEEGGYAGRTEFDSPEVDPEVIIETEKEMKVGEMYEVEITSAEEYDLIAKY
ncbi:MAG: 30S ribosomal protein S12 methylthiotransferase RimO [Bacteroidales bacterium]|nr:30S ribosomal protein S12 methylthiotransferase RimO [Bacteroidales bacterium]